MLWVSPFCLLCAVWLIWSTARLNNIPTFHARNQHLGSRVCIGLAQSESLRILVPTHTANGPLQTSTWPWQTSKLQMKSLSLRSSGKPAPFLLVSEWRNECQASLDKMNIPSSRQSMPVSVQYTASFSKVGKDWIEGINNSVCNWYLKLVVDAQQSGLRRPT